MKSSSVGFDGDLNYCGSNCAYLDAVRQNLRVTYDLINMPVGSKR
jgi:hypothetical protein